MLFIAIFKKCWVLFNFLAILSDVNFFCRWEPERSALLRTCKDFDWGIKKQQCGNCWSEGGLPGRRVRVLAERWDLRNWRGDAASGTWRSGAVTSLASSHCPLADGLHPVQCGLQTLYTTTQQTLRPYVTRNRRLHLNPRLVVSDINCELLEEEIRWWLQEIWLFFWRVGSRRQSLLRQAGS